MCSQCNYANELLPLVLAMMARETEHGNLIFQRGSRSVCNGNEEKLVRNYGTNFFFSEVCCAATNSDVHADFSLATKDSDMKEEERGGGGKEEKKQHLSGAFTDCGLAATPTK